MRFEEDRIVIDRELSLLDEFAIKFLDILKKHSRYVVVSGYVSILLGRSRASEDIDIIIPKLAPDKIEKLVEELYASGFYCLNATAPKEIFAYLADRTAVRFAIEGNVIPNMEMKFTRSMFDDLALTKTVEVILENHTIVISHLEMQIAFKEAVLKSPKDLEDAKHIRIVAAGHFDPVLVEKYKVMLSGL